MSEVTIEKTTTTVEIFEENETVVVPIETTTIVEIIEGSFVHTFDLFDVDTILTGITGEVLVNQDGNVLTSGGE